MAEQPVATQTGLFTRDSSPVPLAGVAIDAEISACCARVVVTQRYVNRETTPIEAVYVFPLDEGAAVSGFEAIVDGTLVIGEVKEREEAFRSYDDALEAGDGAFLLDEERPDVFQACVGNLPPGKEVLLKLTYVTELAVEGQALRFSIPTTVSPRYAPPEDRVGVGRPDAETLNPPVAWRVPYGSSLTVRLDMPGAITRIESPSHPVSVVTSGREATVALSGRDAALDRDFVLSVECEGLDAPQAWIEQDDDGRLAAAVCFVPRFEQKTVPSEVIFLVDRSGSMGGTSIEEVRNALQLCLRSLVPGCRFNIVGFGSTLDPLFPESREYDESSLAAASAHVAAMEADLGGTDILPALAFVVGRPRRAGLSRQVVVLTDGEVTNTDAVIGLARDHKADMRVFTFGIGAGASDHVVRGLARAAGGVAEHIHPGERIEPKVLRQFARLLSPALGDVCLDWNGLVTDAQPTVPPVFDGGRLVQYGFVEHARPATIRLTANGPSGPLSFAIPFDPSRAVAGRIVATLAARARIRELEESADWGAARGSRQGDRKASAVKAAIVTLSIRYGLISRETSFVAIERRDTPVVGNLQLRRVPIALTAGWGGLDRLEPWAARAGGLVVAEPLLAQLFSPAPPASGVYALDGDEQFRDESPSFCSAPPAPHAPAASGPRPLRAFNRSVAHAPRGMQTLVGLQRADGSWKLNRRLADAIAREFADVEAALPAAAGEADEIRTAWATALALAWLEQHAGQVKAEWTLLAAKARTWIDTASTRPANGESWLAAATQFLS